MIAAYKNYVFDLSCYRKLKERAQTTQLHSDTSADVLTLTLYVVTTIQRFNSQKQLL